jgi:2-phospho-L-lactate guanylyltransferase (CobY/MobA/RfbA family)
MQVNLVIPIKQLENAKQRLGSLLDADQRRSLFRAMVEDVLEAGTACDRIDQVVVVTADDTVAALGLQYGARIMPEPANPGLINAVTHAAAVFKAEGVDVMIFLPGDTPLVNAEELEVVLDGIGHSDQPELLFGFGEDSFRRHLKLARERGIEPMVAKLPGIGLDIDTPDDLQTLVNEIIRHDIKSHTYRCLLANGLLYSSEQGGIVALANQR